VELLSALGFMALVDQARPPRETGLTLGVCCVLCAVCCVLCAVCCVLCAVCCVLFCAVYCSALCTVLRCVLCAALCAALCAVCCVLCAVCCLLCHPSTIFLQPPSPTTNHPLDQHQPNQRRRHVCDWRGPSGQEHSAQGHRAQV